MEAEKTRGRDTPLNVSQKQGDELLPVTNLF